MAIMVLNVYIYSNIARLREAKRYLEKLAAEDEKPQAKSKRGGRYDFIEAVNAEQAKTKSPGRNKVVDSGGSWYEEEAEEYSYCKTCSRYHRRGNCL